MLSSAKQPKLYMMCWSVSITILVGTQPNTQFGEVLAVMCTRQPCSGCEGPGSFDRLGPSRTCSKGGYHVRHVGPRTVEDVRYATGRSISDPISDTDSVSVVTQERKCCTVLIPVICPPKETSVALCLYELALGAALGAGYESIGL